MSVVRGVGGIILAAAIGFCLIGAAGFKLHADIARAGHYAREVRAAQKARAHVLRFQLDEETSIRGFSATLDPLYLEPYRKAEHQLPPVLAELRRHLAALGLANLDGLAVRERNINTLWRANIARPLLSLRSRSPRMLAVQRRGKQLIDTFRNTDQTLEQALEGAALASDASIERVVFNTSAFVLTTLAVLAFGAAGFSLSAVRAARNSLLAKFQYENEKRVADSLQEAFLNPGLPTAPAIKLRATYIPAGLEVKIGGDWYDAFMLPDKRILFSIGDVAGHGIDAAVIMSRARQAIIAAALNEDDPAAILQQANQALCLQKSGMVTAICGQVDPRTRQISYATAGHPPPVLARIDEPASFLPYEGVPLGIVPAATYRTFMSHASEGAILVLYTDGVVEHARDILRGEQELLAAARASIGDDDPALSITRRVLGTSAPNDDVAVLTIQFLAVEGGRAIRVMSGLSRNRGGIDPGEGAIVDGRADPGASRSPDS